MAFSLQRILKGIRIFKEGTLTPSNIDIIPGGTDSTTTTIQAAQTANRILTLPDNTGTILSTASTIDLDQLETVTVDKVLVSDSGGTITASTTDSTQLQYLDNATSDIQDQIDDVVSDLSTETAARIAGDATLTSSKANVSLNNILPTTAVDFNGQKITNAGTPTIDSDLTTKAYVDAAVTGGGANTTLSNLTSPTAINQNLIPSGSRTLGDSSSRWNQSHVGLMYGETLLDSNSGSARVALDFSRLMSGVTTKLDWSGTDISINTRKITNVSDPTSAQDVATKNYVDTQNYSIRYEKSSTQLFGTGSEAAITSWTKDWDTDDDFNPTTGKFTAPTSGKYEINIMITISSAAYVAGATYIMRGYQTGSLSKNINLGVLAFGNNSTSNNTATLIGAASFNLTLGDELELTFVQDSGSNRSILASANHNHFTIKKISL